MGLLSKLLGKGVSATEAHDLVTKGALLLDVRERSEWNAGRAPFARHVPLGQLQARLGEVPRDRKVVVVCRSGNRSAHATALLQRAGIDAVNLSGGMHAWSGAGLPVVAEGRNPGRIA